MILKSHIQVEWFRAIGEANAQEGSAFGLFIDELEHKISRRIRDAFDGRARVLVDRALAKELTCRLLIELYVTLGAFRQQTQPTHPVGRVEIPVRGSAMHQDH